VDPEYDTKANATVYVDEVARVLGPVVSGSMLHIDSHIFSNLLLQRSAKWETDVETLEVAPGTFEYFIFMMTRSSE
jgi:hypothetical protein